MAKTTANTSAAQASKQLDQLKGNAETTLNEVKQATSGAIERLEDQATEVTDSVQKNVAGIKAEVNSRIDYAKTQFTTTKQSLSELAAELNAESTTAANELISTAQATFDQVKDVLVKAKEDAVAQLSDTKGTTFAAWEKFKK